MPICAAATCTVPAGLLALQKERIGADNKIILGCIDDALEFVSLEPGSTYSWVSMGKVGVFGRSTTNVSVQIPSKVILRNYSWTAISSIGKPVGRGSMAFLNMREYAKIENGIVTELISAKRGAEFPAAQTWAITPYSPNDRKSRSERIRRGYRYKEGQFFAPDGSSRGTQK